MPFPDFPPNVALIEPFGRVEPMASDFQDTEIPKLNAVLWNRITFIWSALSARRQYKSHMPTPDLCIYAL